MSRLGFGLGLDVIQAVAAGGAGPSGADLKTDLVAWWSMDETSGTRVDSHDNAYTLGDFNTVGSDTGKVGDKAALFDDAQDEWLRRNVAAETWQMGTGDLTIAFWGKFTAFDTGAIQTIVATGANASSGTEEGYCVYVKADGSGLKIQLNAEGSSLISLDLTFDGGTLNTGQWYFFVIEFDRDGSMSVEVDGVIETDTQDISSKSAEDVVTVQNLEFGRAASTLTLKLNGQEDEVAMWNRVLTSGEKTWLYNSNSGRAYSEIG